MEKLKVWVMLLTIAVIGVSPSLAQTGKELEELRQVIDALQEGQKAIQRDLQEIKNLLRTRPAPAAQAPSGDEDLPNVMLSIDGTPFKGEKNARLTLIDFTDYQ